MRSRAPYASHTRALMFASVLCITALASCGLVQDTPDATFDADFDSGVIRDGAGARDGASDAGRDAPKPDAESIDATVPANIAHVSAGGGTNCFLFSNGKLKCCGVGQYGAMGQGSTDDMCANPNTVGTFLPWIDLGTNRRIKTAANDDTHACVILENGRVKCWGSDLFNGLGYGGVPTTRGTSPGQLGDALPELSLDEAAKSIYVARSSTCAILSSGKLKCWGDNNGGKLGGGSKATIAVADPVVDLGSGHTALSVALTNIHCCAILDDHRVKCWGRNYRGQLGLGDTLDRGDESGEMGDNLPYVNLGTGRTAKQIVATPDFTCALLDNDSVKCWGDNLSGQLGIGRADETWGDQQGQMGDNLPEVNLGTGLTPKQLVSQGNFACVLFTNGQIKCWGARPLGVAATAPEGPDNRGRSPSDMGDNLPFVELGTGRSAKSISMGGGLCALLDNDRVKCWGGGLYGTLGYGDRSDRWGGPAYSGDNMPYVDLGN